MQVRRVCQRIGGHQAVDRRGQARPATKRLQRGPGDKPLGTCCPVGLQSPISGWTSCSSWASGPTVRKKGWMQMRREQGQAGARSTPLPPSVTPPDSRRATVSPSAEVPLWATLTRNHTGKGVLGNVVLSLAKATPHSPPGLL